MNLQGDTLVAESPTNSPNLLTSVLQCTSQVANTGNQFCRTLTPCSMEASLNEILLAACQQVLPLEQADPFTQLGDRGTEDMNIMKIS